MRFHWPNPFKRKPNQSPVTEKEKEPAIGMQKESKDDAEEKEEKNVQPASY